MATIALFASAYNLLYSKVYQLSTVFESHGKRTDPVTESVTSPPKQPLSPAELNGVNTNWWQLYFYDPDDPEIATPVEHILCRESLPDSGLIMISCDANGDPYEIHTGDWCTVPRAVEPYQTYSNDMIRFSVGLTHPTVKHKSFEMPADFCYARALGKEVQTSSGSWQIVSPADDPDSIMNDFQACVTLDYNTETPGTHVHLQIYTVNDADVKCYLPDVEVVLSGTSASPDEKCVYSYDREDCTPLVSSWGGPPVPLDTVVENIGTTLVNVNLKLYVTAWTYNRLNALYPTSPVTITGNLWQIN